MKNRLVDDSEVKYVAADVSGAGVLHHDRASEDKFELVFQEADDSLTVIMDDETLSRVLVEALLWRRERRLRQEVEPETEREWSIWTLSESDIWNVCESRIGNTEEFFDKLDLDAISLKFEMAVRSALCGGEAWQEIHLDDTLAGIIQDALDGGEVSDGD